MGMEQSPVDWGDSGSWRAYGDSHLTSDGTGQGKAIPERVTRVLNRAQWSSRALSRIVLLLLVSIFVPADAPIIVGLDETIERRRRAKIAAKGIYRDPVRSSKDYCVKTSGLRWVCMMLLVPIPSAKRVWAFPFLSILAPRDTLL